MDGVRHVSAAHLMLNLIPGPDTLLVPGPGAQLLLSRSSAA